MARTASPSAIPSVAALLLLAAAVASCGRRAPEDVARATGTSSAAPFANGNASGTSALVGAPSASQSAVVLGASPGTAVTGEPVTFTATVSAISSAETPTGAVTFLDGAAVLCGAVPIVGDQASCTTGLRAGTHPVTASYGGDASYDGSTSAATLYGVTAAATTTALGAAPSPSTYTESVTLTATVAAAAPGGGTPTGTVTFRDGGIVLCDAVALVGGAASCPTAALDAGVHGLAADYSGDGDFDASTSAALPLSVAPAASATVLAASPTPSVFGQAVTFTATVAGPGATPAGAVTFREGGSVLCAAVSLSGGVATCTAPGLAVGYHDMTATYGGSARHAASTSPSVSHAVGPASTSVAIAGGPNPSVLGGTVAFTATASVVAPGAGTPDGTVTFTADGSPLCTDVPLVSRAASCATAALSVGSHTVVATYAGGTGFWGSTSPAIVQTVAKPTPTVALVPSPSSTVLGEPLVLVATVSSGAGSPTGTVTFWDGVMIICNAVPLTGGIASCTTSSLTAVSHTLVASYSGDAQFQGVAATSSQRVNAASTTTTLSTDSTPSTFGQGVTFTAAVAVVAPGAGTPVGAVTFSDGATPLCANVALSGGIARCTASSLAVGSHRIAAIYYGVGGFADSASSALPQDVERATAAVALSVTPSPSVFGQPVTFRTTVTTAGGVPGGTVTFSDGGGVLCAAVALVAGEASCSVSALPAGTHPITASYSGDAGFLPGTDGGAHVVGAASTGTALVAAPSPGAFGQPVTFTATVGAVAPGAGTPAGAITFSDGAIVLCNAVPLVAGAASCTTSSLAAAAHAVVASYGGSANHAASASSAFPLTVAPATPTISLGVTPSPSVFGEGVVLTASVTSPVGSPAGAVTFRDGATALCGAVNLVSGRATCATSALSVGSHALAADYLGAGDFQAASAAAAHVVSKAATGVAFLCDGSRSVYGQPVTCTATVGAEAPGAGAPTGAVTLKDGAAIIGSAGLDGAGVVTFTSSALDLGPHALTAEYAGDAGFAASSSPGVAQTVSVAPTHVALGATPVLAAFGEPVTFTATVTADAPSGAVPVGSVQFLDGATALGTVPLDGAGRATLTTSALAVASHSATAVFEPGARFTGSTSPVATTSVVRGTSAVAVASSLMPSTYGDAITFTATVTASAPATGTPTGTVTFRDGAAVLGTRTLDPSGQATLTTPALTAGGHAITVDYAGDAAFTARSSAPFAQAVTLAPASVGLGAGPAPSVTGQPVAFTATVTSPAGTPGGTVSFEESGVPLGAAAIDPSGHASFTAALSAGSHAVVARYLGDANHAVAASLAAIQVVGRADVDVALAVSPTPTASGQPATLTASVTVRVPGAGRPGGTVTFLDSGVPLGTGTLDGSGRATLTTGALPPGGHALTAGYGGDASFAPATTARSVSHTVERGSAAATLLSSAMPSRFGQPVTLTVNVAAVAPAGGTPSGTVTVTDGGATLATLALSGGSASTTTATLAVGSHALAASYGGDGSFEPATATLTQSVERAGTSTAVVSWPNPSQYGQAVTFTATVTTIAPGAGTPSGAVTFKDGAATLGVATLRRSGVATWTTAALNAASHTVTAEYAGDASWAASTGTATHAVEKRATQLSLAASPSVARYGEAVTLTATASAVGPGTGVPTGTVAFEDGGTVLGTAPIDSNGRATLAVRSLGSGPHPLTVEYAGDGNFDVASAGAAVTVKQAATTVAVSSARNPSRRGRTVVFTATATSPTATPAGEVAFKDGEAVLGTAILRDGQASLAVRSLTRGTHPITAEYAGSADFTAATGALPGGEVVENSPPVAASGTALALDGLSRATVDVPGGVLDVTTGTVELWARAAWTAPGDVRGTPILVALGDGAGVRFALGVTPDRRALVVRLGTAERRVPAPLDDGAWHHLALASAPDGASLLVDGAPLARLDGGFSGAVPGRTLTIGEGVVGAIDEVRIWSASRDPAALAGDLRRPLRGDEGGLVGYWRMDEGSGRELFDSSPSALDGTVALPPSAPDDASPFTPSAAWRLREVVEDRDLAPVDAGYDADGDPLALALAAPASNGVARADEPQLQIRYQPGPTYLGDDQFGYSLSDGQASSAYTIDVAVVRGLRCRADADCGDGAICVQDRCTSPRILDARSGASGGCSEGGDAGVGWSLVALALLALRRRTRRARDGSAGSAAARLALALAAFAAPAPAPAQTPRGFAVQTYEPSPAGDRLFVVPEATVDGHLAASGSLLFTWSTDPMVLRLGGETLPGFRVVHRQSWAMAQASVPFADAVLVDLTLPVAFYQSGSRPFTDLAQVSAAGLGDLRLGARAALPLRRAFKLAAALDLWIPTGSREAFSSDGKVRVRPKLVAGAEHASWIYGAELGFLYRPAEDLGYTEIGSAVTFSAGAAWRWKSFRFGPELYGRYQFAGTVSSPVEALLGGRWRRGPLEVGVAVGTGLDGAPGAAPFRAVAQILWSPEGPRTRVEPVLAPLALPVPEPSPEPDPARAPAPEPEGPPAPETRSETDPSPPAEEPPAVAATEAVPEPLASPPAALVQGQRIEIRAAVQFERDQAKLLPPSAAVLRDVASTLAAHPEIHRVVVEGHTDARGNAKHNTALSERRARAVRQWLVDKGGISPERLDAKGFGPARPIAPNATPDGRARNRRVEFRIVEGG